MDIAVRNNLAKGRKAAILAAVLLLIFFVWFFSELRPVSRDSQFRIFEIRRGEKFLGIASRLERDGLIRSSFAFELYAVMTGSALTLKPGSYELRPASSVVQIISVLTEGRRGVTLRVPDGASVSDVDAILSGGGVFSAGRLVSFASSHAIEGKLYPDTYSFLEHSTAEEVSAIFLKNFEAKAAPILDKDKKHFDENLILASLVQKEVSDSKDARIVAGILKKRLAAGVALNVDATVCYLKKEIKRETKCYPLAPGDFKIESPYNTYLHPGLPPGPIGSPEGAAIDAVMNPTASPYWFYLSDPKTGKTIFSKTLDEQSANKARYLH